MKIGQFELEVLVHGHDVKEYVHEGETFIEGRNKRDYKIRFRNNSNRRVLAVISVDGLSVMDGKEARLSSGGYVIEARRSLEIPGWRLNDDEVAKFIFGGAGESYAAKMDKPANIGVIGCAVFEEKVPLTFPPLMHDSFPIRPPRRFGPSHTRFPGGMLDDSDRNIVYGARIGSSIASGLPKEEVSRRITADATPDPVSSSGVQNLGTGFGEKEEHRVVSVSFDPCDQPVALFSIVYDTKAGLENRGIAIKEPTKVALNPFPAEGRGCPPPPGWRYR